MARDNVSRSLHDLGLAAWFGGTLANAVALNPAASAAKDASDTGAVANVGWDRWTPPSYPSPAVLSICEPVPPAGLPVNPFPKLRVAGSNPVSRSSLEGRNP